MGSVNLSLLNELGNIIRFIRYRAKRGIIVAGTFFDGSKDLDSFQYNILITISYMTVVADGFSSTYEIKCKFE